MYHKKRREEKRREGKRREGKRGEERSEEERKGEERRGERRREDSPGVIVLNVSRDFSNNLLNGELPPSFSLMTAMVSLYVFLLLFLLFFSSSNILNYFDIFYFILFKFKKIRY